MKQLFLKLFELTTFSIVAIVLVAFLLIGTVAYASLTFTNDDVTSDEDLNIAGSGVFIDSTGLLELNSSAGGVSVGNDSVSQNIILGNLTGSTRVDILTGTAGMRLFGHVMVIRHNGTDPTASQDAGAPTLKQYSTDTAGTVTSDTTAHTRVTVTFSTNYSSPSCVVTPGNAEAAAIAGSPTGFYVVPSATELTINHAADTTAAIWHYHCIGLIPPDEA